MPDLPTPVPEPNRTRRIEALVQRTQQAVLAAVEEMLKRQLAPALDYARQAILSAAAEMVQKEAEPLLLRVKGLTLETVEELIQRQIEPFLARTRQLVLEGLENATVVQKYTDAITNGLKTFMAETVAEVFRVHIPAYTRRAGHRVMDYAVAGTLYCLAVILLLLGGIFGLQQLGLPRYSTYLIGGAVAGGAAFLLLRFRARAPARGDEQMEDACEPSNTANGQIPGH
jgi:hypothetical protein